MSRSKVIQTGKNAIVEYLDSKKNAIVEYLDYQIPVTQLSTSTIRYPLLSYRDQSEMEICKQQSEIEMRHLPAVYRFKHMCG